MGLHMQLIYSRETSVGNTNGINRDEVRNRIVHQIKTSKVPLYVLPEGGTTNGKGVLFHLL